jgi:hypothetical protein
MITLVSCSASLTPVSNCPCKLTPVCCDGVYSGFTDAHLNGPADFWGAKTNKMFVLTQVANHDALHYGNLVTYLRLNGLVPSGG